MAGNRWIRWDIGYFRNSKARALGKDGRALHLASACWSADNLTDGFIPTHMLGVLCADAEVKPRTAVVMVAAGAWVPVEGGWRLHDFLDHNKSKAEVEAERSRWAKQKSGQRRMSTADSRLESGPDALADVTRRDVIPENVVTQLPVLTLAHQTTTPDTFVEAIDLIVAAKREAYTRPIDNMPAFLARTRENVITELGPQVVRAVNDGADARTIAESHVTAIWVKRALRHQGATA